MSPPRVRLVQNFLSGRCIAGTSGGLADLPWGWRFGRDSFRRREGSFCLEPGCRAQGLYGTSAGYGVALWTKELPVERGFALDDAFAWADEPASETG